MLKLFKWSIYTVAVIMVAAMFLVEPHEDSVFAGPTQEELALKAEVVAEVQTVAVQELTHEEQMEVQLDKAHEQYATALRQKDSGQRWFGSTHLPRVGSIRADDYRWCKHQGWNRNADEHDFCAWHAGIGTWHK